MKKWIPLLVVFAAALVGCSGGKEEFKVDENDPSSVANASQSEPVPMRSDGTPVQAGQQAEPPAKP